jgi:phage-related protein
VTFNGRTYKRFPISISELEENARGDLPVLDVSVSNATREVQSFLERRNGLLDRSVKLYIVSTALLSDASAAVSQKFTITSSFADAERVTFRLSQLPLVEVKMPHQIYSRSRCRWEFKSAECGWGLPSLPAGVGDSAACTKLRTGTGGCEWHGQQYLDAGQTSLWPARFGGFPTIPRRRQ